MLTTLVYEETLTSLFLKIVTSNKKKKQYLTQKMKVPYFLDYPPFFYP